MSVRPRPRLPQLPIPSQTGNNPNYSSISINTRISLDIKVHSMKITANTGWWVFFSNPQSVHILLARSGSEQIYTHMWWIYINLRLYISNPHSTAPERCWPLPNDVQLQICDSVFTNTKLLIISPQICQRRLCFSGILSQNCQEPVTRLVFLPSCWCTV
jgi:hypothetical protein